jgi:hypothetical protein
MTSIAMDAELDEALPLLNQFSHLILSLCAQYGNFQ